MSRSRNLTLALVTVLFVTVGWLQHPQAYIDLGTGSYLLQMLVASFFGIVFSAKAIWERVRSLLTDSDRRGKQ